MMQRIWYSEQLLATHLNVSRNSLEEFRSSELKKNEGWMKRGREIFLDEEAVRVLKEHLGCENMDLSGCREKNGANPPPADAPIELTVSRVFPNPHLLECVKPGTQERVRVRVISNKNFRPRMTLKAKPDTVAPGLYRLEGRTPRFPGRW